MNQTLHAPRAGTRQLDSLRGIAAVCVMLHHYAWMRLDTQLQRPAVFHGFWIGYRILHPLVLGQEAVLLFFTLSGFVLTLALDARRRLRYPAYVAHRTARIYLPYLAALILAVACNAYLHGRVPTWTESGGRFWKTLPSVSDVAAHATLIGIYVHRYNPVFWSLIVEMRVSFLMPFIYLGLRKMQPRNAATLLICVTACDAVLMPLVQKHGTVVLIDLLSTIHYAIFFALGSFLALHRHQAVKILAAWPIRRAQAFLLLCIFLLGYGWALTSQHLRLVQPDCVGALASAGLILCALALPPFQKLLLARPLLWLGKVSYSLYLLHTTIMFAVSALFGRRVAYWQIEIVCIFLSLVGSWFFWRLVEEPARLLGRRLDKVPHGDPARPMLFQPHPSALAATGPVSAAERESA